MSSLAVPFPLSFQVWSTRRYTAHMSEWTLSENYSSNKGHCFLTSRSFGRVKRFLNQPESGLSGRCGAEFKTKQSINLHGVKTRTIYLCVGVIYYHSCYSNQKNVSQEWSNFTWRKRSKNVGYFMAQTPCKLENLTPVRKCGSIFLYPFLAER